MKETMKQNKRKKQPFKKGDVSSERTVRKALRPLSGMRDLLPDEVERRGSVVDLQDRFFQSGDIAG